MGSLGKLKGIRKCKNCGLSVGAGNIGKITQIQTGLVELYCKYIYLALNA